MFLSVPAKEEAACRDHPDQFKVHRKAQFSAWGKGTLESYLEDLKKAEKTGENLITLKYARMENLISIRNKNPVVDIIADIQFSWQNEMFAKYPKLMGGARPLRSGEDSDRATSFETYLKCELETYSDRTLHLLYGDTREMKKKGLNMSEEIYSCLLEELGYDSLEAFEK